MAYSPPIGPNYPRYAVAVRHPEIEGSYPVVLTITHSLGDQAEADADVIVQKAIDVLTRAGFELVEASKEYEYRQAITATPAA